MYTPFQSPFIVPFITYHPFSFIQSINFLTLLSPTLSQKRLFYLQFLPPMVISSAIPSCFILPDPTGSCPFRHPNLLAFVLVYISIYFFTSSFVNPPSNFPTSKPLTLYESLPLYPPSPFACSLHYLNLHCLTHASTLNHIY